MPQVISQDDATTGSYFQDFVTVTVECTRKIAEVSVADRIPSKEIGHTYMIGYRRAQLIDI